MGQPITCTKCRRPFNAKFAKCPFCGADAAGAMPQNATQERLEPRRCVSCHKPFNATFAKCPHCGVAANAEAPARPAIEELPDWTAIADHVVAHSRPLQALEFHPAAVAALDAFFDVTWGTEGIAAGDPSWKPTEGQLQIILQFGCFYGELMRREFHGRWQADPKQLLSARVVYGQRYAVPIVKVYKRMLLGAAEQFEAEYMTERLHMGIRGTPAEAGGWLRQAQHFDNVGRMDLVGAFCARGLALDPVGDTKMELTRLGNKAYQAKGS
ncbi:MAG TPA: zinc ribbon domain-containing protein [Polyangium sp.]|nr:zinc ribbon domain-containing protein [Polyangium sp.]